MDKQTKGTVSKLEFEKVSHQTGVYLGKDDMNKIVKLYGVEGQINYQTMSKDLGIHV